MAVAKNENLRIFLPYIYTNGECHKVQEKHFAKPFLTSPSPWGSARTKVKIENHQIVPFDSLNEAS